MAEQAIGARMRSRGTNLYVVLAGVAALLIFVGFAPSYYLKSVIHAPPPLSPLTVAHGAVYTLWVLLFLAQVSLAAAGKLRWHRQLGMAGAMLFGAMIVLGLSTTITAGRLGHAPPGAPPPLQFMALPFFGLAAAAVLVALALINRTRRDWHQRLMIVGFLIIAQPGMGRIFIGAGQPSLLTYGSFAMTDALLLGAVLWDFRGEGRVHPAWTVGALVLAAEHLAVTWAYAAPPLWMDFATWMIRSA